MSVYAAEKGEKKQNWATPQNLVDGWKVEYGLNLDVCCELWNCKLPAGITEKEDGLVTPWCHFGRIFDPTVTMGKGPCWLPGHSGVPNVAYCNPPYSQTPKWLQKALWEAKEHGVFTLMLIPASTGTNWFYEAATTSGFWLFRQRIKFIPPPDSDGQKDRPNFSPALLEIGGKAKGFLGYRSNLTGKVVYNASVGYGV